MDSIRVHFDRVPGRDQYALYVFRRSIAGAPEALGADGDWHQYEEFTNPDPTLTISGLTWQSLKAPLLKELGGLPEASAETEVRVLREWLEVERARVEKAFSR